MSTTACAAVLNACCADDRTTRTVQQRSCDCVRATVLNILKIAGDMEHYVINHDATLRDDTAGISIRATIYRPKMACCCVWLGRPKHPTLNLWNSWFPLWLLLIPRLWLAFCSKSTPAKFGRCPRGGQFRVGAPAMGFHVPIRGGYQGRARLSKMDCSIRYHTKLAGEP